MVRRAHNHRMTRQTVHLHQQRRHYALDFTCLLGIATFLAHCLEFIKEEHAGIKRREFNQATQTVGCFTEKAIYDGIVAN